MISEEKIVPQILKDIVEFFQWWDNPKDEKGEYKSISMFQTMVYMPSISFVFKWLVSEEELKESAQYIGNEIVNNTIQFSLADYKIELSLNK